MFNLNNKSGYFEDYNAGKITSAVIYALPYGAIAYVDELCGVSTLTLSNNTFTNDAISTALTELNVKGLVLIEIDNHKIYVGPSLRQALTQQNEDILDRITVNVISKCPPTIGAATFPIVHHNPIKIDHHKPSKTIDRLSRNQNIGTFIIEATHEDSIKYYIFNPNRYIVGNVTNINISEQPSMTVDVIHNDVKHSVNIHMFSTRVRNDLLEGKIDIGDSIIMLYSSYLGNNKLNAFTSPTAIKYRK